MQATPAYTWRMRSVLLACALVGLVGCSALDPSLGDAGNRVLDVEIDGVETFSGRVTGDLIVSSRGNLTLNGQVLGDLIVADGGRAEVYGMVLGDVINQGGDVIIYGQVDGQVVDEGGTETVLAPGAVVGGEVIR